MGTASDTAAAKREFVADAVAETAHMTAGSERLKRENAAGSVKGQMRGREMATQEKHPHPSQKTPQALNNLPSDPYPSRKRGLTGAGLISVLMAEPGPGPDRCNQPSRLASMTNLVRRLTTNRRVVRSNPDSNPDRNTENVNRMNMDSCEIVVLAALGRPFSLGMLYDCRNDSLIPGK
ncbi:unnamed protein product [Arctogadus glacialis]